MGKNYKENFSEMAKYFKLNPKKYEIALELGNRLSKLKYMEVDDPEIEKLAKEGAEFIKNEPVLKKCSMKKMDLKLLMKIYLMKYQIDFYHQLK